MTNPTRITAEVINGRFVTVIRRPFDADWVREQLAVGAPVLAATDWAKHTILCEYRGEKSTWFAFDDYDYEMDDYPSDFYSHTVTILPALPKHPKPEDAALLYAYMAEGLTPCVGVEDDDWACGGALKLDRIVGHTGNDYWVGRDGYIMHNPKIENCETADGHRYEALTPSQAGTEGVAVYE